MGYKYDEKEILAAAVEAVLEEGLSRLSYGRLAARLGIADRSIVYYFPTKHDLIVRTTFALGARLQVVLDQAFGIEKLGHDELIRRAWPVLTSGDANQIFAVFFELVGLGSAGISPYDQLAATVMESWVTWLTERTDSTGVDGRSTALGTIALLDGLLLLRHTLGADAADKAYRQLGYGVT